MKKMKDTKTKKVKGGATVITSEVRKVTAKSATGSKSSTKSTSTTVQNKAKSSSTASLYKK